jgi:adenosylhomocysteine nucleosidase
MDKERALVEQLLANATSHSINGFAYTQGTVGAHQVALLKCGIGKVAAALGASALIESFAPDCIINSGVAGALDPSVGVADVVVASRTVYHDVYCGDEVPLGCIQGFPLYFEADKRLLEAFQQLNLGKEAHVGLICSGDQFITKLAELQTIKKNFPEGLAVDMESCAMAQTCHMLHVPFVSLRVISDTPGINDHMTQYFDFWKIAPEKSFTVLKKLIETLK